MPEQDAKEPASAAEQILTPEKPEALRARGCSMAFSVKGICRAALGLRRHRLRRQR
uniref:Uncharacterized protein n=1 Tax=Zea mays TaxID=4577 RepID=B6U320_MAIZE|nr:hypothetical protein [Zea mays]